MQDAGYNVTTKPERKYVPETVLASEYQLDRSLREHKYPRNDTLSQGERLQRYRNTETISYRVASPVRWILTAFPGTELDIGKDDQ